MDNNNSYIDLLTDSLKKKIILLKEITELNIRQKEAVASEKFDIEEFDAVSEDKGRLLDEINKLDDGFETLYNRVSEELKANKTQYSDKIKMMQDLIQEIMELTTSIEAEEKRIKSSVEGQFIKIKQSIKETRKNSRAVSNYYKNMTKIDSAPQFMDSKK